MVPAVPDVTGEWTGQAEACFVVRASADFKGQCEDETLAALKAMSGRYFRVDAVDTEVWPAGTLYRQEPSDGPNGGQLYMWKWESQTKSGYYIGMVPHMETEDSVLAWVPGLEGVPSGRINFPFWASKKRCKWQTDHVGNPHCI